MSYHPSEHQIRATMARIGCDYMQAYYHCQGAERALQLAEAQRRERLNSAIRALRDPMERRIDELRASEVQ